VVERLPSKSEALSSKLQDFQRKKGRKEGGREGRKEGRK
jgi:hypothetical protein